MSGSCRPLTVASCEEVRPCLRRHDWHRDDWHLPALGVAPARFADRFPLAGRSDRTCAWTPALDIQHPPSRVPGRCRQLRPSPRCRRLRSPSCNSTRHHGKLCAALTASIEIYETLSRPTIPILSRCVSRFQTDVDARKALILPLLRRHWVRHRCRTAALPLCFGATPTRYQPCELLAHLHRLS